MRLWRVPYPKFGKAGAFERVRAIAERLGADLAQFGQSGAVIVGSNGKGSTAAMTAALLEQGGASVGLFTSPHLFDLNERFRIDGEDIGDDELAHHWDRVAAAAEVTGKTAELGGFEFLFLIAADAFAARGCALTVWEAGIGGRHDVTRLTQPRRVALTSLDLEHTQLLGQTMEQIARDKIDAAPAGATLYVGESCAPLYPAIEEHCAAQGVAPVFVGANALGAVTPPLAGGFQRANAALALSLARDMAYLGDDAIARGLAATRWPGRLEKLSDNPLVVIDVGHTPAAIAAALEGFHAMRGGREAVLVCGASQDKDAAAIIGALAPSFATIICAAARHKGASAAEIAAHANGANAKAEIVLGESVADARRLALSRAGGGGAIYVAGGLFLAAEYRAAHFGRDPALLAFF